MAFCSDFFFFFNKTIQKSEASQLEEPGSFFVLCYIQGRPGTLGHETAAAAPNTTLVTKPKHKRKKNRHSPSGVFNLGRTAFPEASKQISSCIPLAHGLPLNNHWKREWGECGNGYLLSQLIRIPVPKLMAAGQATNRVYPRVPQGLPQDQSSGGIPQVTYW